VPYYRSLFKKESIKPSDIKSPEDMRKIPVTTKEDFRKNFPDKVTAKNVDKKNFMLNSTSGSTGTPFAFYIDKQLIEMERAHLQRGYSWAGLSFGERFISLWGPHNVTFAKRITEFFKRRKMLSAFEMNDEKMSCYVDEISRYRPKIIEAYVSAVYGLSKFMLDKGIRVGGVNSVVTSAETLSSAHREAIEEAFSCPVYNRYGSREFGTIAHECEEHAGLHVGCESFYVEFLKEDGSLADDGEQGKIMVTSLENYAMPFLRYDTGDLGVFSDEKCACGRKLPLIKELSGRVIDLVKTPSGKIISVHYLTLLFEDYSQYFKNFQAIQRRKDFLEVLVEPTEKLSKEVEEEVVGKIREHTGGDMKVSMKRVSEIPLSSAGKRTILRSEVK
jgi:phenylacetate-CoA ligase